MTDNDDMVTKYFKVLSYVVFLTLYAIIWRNMYKQSQHEFDEAFSTMQKSQEPIDAEDTHFENPPYSLFKLLVNIFMIVMWLVLYLVAMFVATWVCDYLIIQNSIQEDSGGETNYVYNVLSLFMVDEIGFIVEACMICVILVSIMAIVIAIVFPHLMLNQNTARTFVTLTMIMILIAIPLVSLLKLVLEPLLTFLNIEG